MRKRIKTLQDVFLPEYRSIDENGCWNWMGTKDPYGYGFFTRQGRQIRIHRYVLESVTGKILGDLHALHRCDNPSCFNPSHLFAGTPLENMRDMEKKGRAKRSTGRSSIAGVVWVKGRNRWRVLRYESGRQVTYGEFAELEDALKRNSELRKEGGEKH